MRVISVVARLFFAFDILPGRFSAGPSAGAGGDSRL